MSKGWHYQLMRHTKMYAGEPYTYYAIHEYYPAAVFPEGDGDGWTHDPCDVTGDSVEDVVWLLKAMLNDIEKHGVKDYVD